jgi:monoterpene epsilon-lactone hydrolase
LFNYLNWYLIAQLMLSLWMLTVLALLVGAAAAASAGPAQSGAKCSLPPRPADAARPYCQVPAGVSPEAQAVLRSMAAAPAPDISTPTAAAAMRVAWRRGKTSVWEAPGRSALRAARNETLAGVPTLLIEPAAAAAAAAPRRPLILYLHGGAYAAGSCHLQWATAAGVASALGAPARCVDYRLAPEHPFPAGLDDVAAAYAELLRAHAPRDIALLGDSAGGGLVMALLLKLRRLGLPAPAAAVLYSPWVELTKAGDTHTTLTGVDPMLQYDMNLRAFALAYVAGDASKLSDPLVSPLRADYSKAAAGELPPVLIQIGLRDTFLSDSAALYRKLRAAGQPVEFSPWVSHRGAARGEGGWCARGRANDGCCMHGVSPLGPSSTDASHAALRTRWVPSPPPRRACGMCSRRGGMCRRRRPPAPRRRRSCAATWACHLRRRHRREAHTF